LQSFLYPEPRPGRSSLLAKARPQGHGFRCHIKNQKSAGIPIESKAGSRLALCTRQSTDRNLLLAALEPVIDKALPRRPDLPE